MAIKNFNAEKLILSTLTNDSAPTKFLSMSSGGDLKTTVLNYTAWDALESNVSTALSIGTITATTFAINSDGSSPDITLPEANTTQAGLLGADKWDEIVANSLKTSNIVQTNMSGISDTKANFNTSLSDGTFIFEGDARLTDDRDPTSHTLLGHTIAGETTGHVLAADSATTFSIRQLIGSEINNDQSWTAGITDITGETLSDLSDIPAEPTAGALEYYLKYNDTGDVFTWVNITTLGASTLSDLTDVSSATQTSGFVIASSGGNYAGRALVAGDIPALAYVATGITTLSGYGISDTKANFNTALSDGTFIYEGDARLTDDRDPTSHTLLSHTIAGETTGHVLAADSATTYSIRQLLGSEINNDSNWISNITGETLSSLSDIPAEPTAGALEYYLKYNDTGDVFTWVDITTLAGASALADLSDVTSATQTSGFVIASSGSNYAGRALVAGDIPSLSYLADNLTTLSQYAISDTKANFDTALSDGTFVFEGDARLTDARTPTSHTLLGHTIAGETTGHVLAADSATTFSIRQLLGSEISNTESWAADQTAISDFTGTKAQFDTACTDGNFVFDGDVIPVASGGTNIASYAIGDLLYASAATTLSKLADVAVGSVLISGGVTTAPSYGKVAIIHLNSELKDEKALGGDTEIDWVDGITFTKTLAAGWTATFANSVIGKTIMVVTTGDYTITWPSGVDASADFGDYDGTKRNVHFLTCVSTSIPLYSGSVKAYTI